MSTARRLVGAALAAVLAAASLGAQQETLPQFRGGTDVVAVDFYAVDKDGHPVPDLKPDELKLKVGDELRPIRLLEFVRVAPGEDVDTPTPADDRAPLAYGSNLPQDSGRLVFIVFEAMSPEDTLTVKAALPGFLGQLSPRDRVGLVSFPQGRVEVDLTTDRQRILSALGEVTVHASAVDAMGMGGCDSPAVRAPFDALVDILDGIAHLDGPKVVVLLSQAMLHTRNIGCISWEFDRVAVAASAARVHMFGMMPYHFESSASVAAHRGSDGFLTAGDSRGGGDLGDLIAATGGEQFYVPARATNIFTRIARESSAYYLLSFDTTEKDRTGKLRHIALTTSRPGVTIQARPSFTVESAKDAAKRTAPSSTAGPVRSLLDDYSTHRDLPLRVAAYAFRDTDTTVRLVAAADIPGGGALTQVQFGLFDAKGKATTDWVAPQTELGHAQAVASATTAPGAYRLRVGASDSAGRVGAADFEFTAGLTKAGAFTMSDLMLGHAHGSDFVPQLAFSTETSIAAYAEVYGSMPAGARPTAIVEVADQMKSEARLKVPATLTPTRDADRWIVSANVPLNDLDPGDYVVRLVLQAAADSAELGRVVRTLHKTR
jgi:VWFA-related protein